MQEREQQRLEKIHSLQKTDIQSALDTYVQTQKDIEETTKTKEEIAAENREKKLREKLEKLKAKKEHAEAVRQRRLLAAVNQANTENDSVSSPLPAVGSTPDEPNPAAAPTE
jgi:alpha-glucuronidase